MPDLIYLDESNLIYFLQRLAKWGDVRLIEVSGVRYIIPTPNFSKEVKRFLEVFGEI
jgi:hypothetical protein